MSYTSYVLYLMFYVLWLTLMTYLLCLMSYILCFMSYILYTFEHFYLVLGRVIWAYAPVALAGYTSTPKGGYGDYPRR